MWAWLSPSHQLVSGSQDCAWPTRGSRPAGSWASQAWGANWAPLIWLPVRWPELSPWVEPLACSSDTRHSLWGTPGFTQSHVSDRTLLQCAWTEPAMSLLLLCLTYMNNIFDGCMFSYNYMIVISYKKHFWLILKICISYAVSFKIVCIYNPIGILFTLSLFSNQDHQNTY